MANLGMPGRKRSLRREIQIGKKQSKSRMLGQTFNPSGITSEEIKARGSKFISDMLEKPIRDRISYYNNMKEMQKTWECSYPWEWCEFERNKYLLIGDYEKERN